MLYIGNCKEEEELEEEDRREEDTKEEKGKRDRTRIEEEITVSYHSCISSLFLLYF
jgi:hypothetical protein